MYASFDEIYPQILRAIPNAVNTGATVNTINTVNTVNTEHYTDFIGPTMSLSNNRFNVDESGNVVLSNNLTVNGGTTFPNGTVVDGNGNVTITGQTNFPNGTIVDSIGNVTVTGQTNLPGGNVVDTSGNITVLGQTNYQGGTFIDALGNATFNQTAYFSGGTYFDASGNITVAGDISSNGYANFANGSYVDNDGNLNINGNATIYNKLNIIGTTTFGGGITFSQGSGYTLPLVNGGTAITTYSVPTSNLYSVIYFTPTAQRIIQMPQTATTGSWYVLTNLSTVVGASLVVKNYNSTVTFETIPPCTAATSAGNSLRFIRTAATWIKS